MRILQLDGRFPRALHAFPCRGQLQGLCSDRMSPRTSLAVATSLLLGLATYVGYLAIGSDPGPGEEPDGRPPAGDVVEPGQAVMQGGTQTEPQFELTLHVEPVAELLPPPPRRPGLRLWRGTTLVPVEGSWVAGPAALPEARVFKGRQLVRFRLPGGREIYRVVYLTGTDQNADQDIDLRWLGSVEYLGQVIGADRGPLAGANVWLAGERAETDAYGRFRIPDLPRGSGLPLVIRAAGHAGTLRVLDLTDPDAGRDIRRNTFGLATGLDLKVRFVAPVEDLTRGAVFVRAASVAAGVGERDTRLLHHPFLMQAVEGGVPLGSDGIATIRGLPKDVTVQVSVWHPDTVICQRLVNLRQRKQATIHGQKAPLLLGEVRGTDNEPVVGAWLVSRGTSTSPSLTVGELLPPLLYLSSNALCGYAITEEDGSYRLPLPPALPARVRVAAPKRLGLALTVRASEERGLVLPRPAPNDEPRLRLRFANASGRTFRLQVRSGDRRVQQPFLLRDNDDYAQPLPTAELADIHVEIRDQAGKVRRWAFPNRVVRGLVELPLDY